MHVCIALIILVNITRWHTGYQAYGRRSNLQVQPVPEITFAGETHTTQLRKEREKEGLQSQRLTASLLIKNRRPSARLFG
eukprot:150241-Pelagomonas_calceolata.AAC.1